MTSKLALLLTFGATVFGQQPLRLTLAEAERLAIQNNPAFGAARYTAAAAAQVPSEYHAAYSPTFFGSVTGVGADNGSRLAAGALNNPVVYNRLGTGMTVSQMITDFGRTHNLEAMAKLNALAQDQVTETTRAQILLATGRAYFDVLRAHAVLAVTEQTVKERQQVSDLVGALAESKMKSTLDVSFAKYNLSEARLLEAQAQNDLKAAEAQFATALGMPNEASFQLSEEPMPTQMPDRIDDLLRTAIANRPELRDLRLEESAAERFVKAEHALYYPSVGLVGTAGFAPAAFETVPGRYGAVGVNLNLPIFNGGLFKARQTEADLKAKAMGQRITDQENRVARDVRVSYLNATTTYDRLGLTKQLLDNAQQALDLAQTRYDAGLSSIIELSQAQLNLTTAQIANTSAIYDYQSQRVVLDYQTGVLR
jgi:outer membrane protein